MKKFFFVMTLVIVFAVAACAAEPVCPALPKLSVETNPAPTVTPTTIDLILPNQGIQPRVISIWFEKSINVLFVAKNFNEDFTISINDSVLSLTLGDNQWNRFSAQENQIVTVEGQDFVIVDGPIATVRLQQ
jgi:hypothetical protein